MQWYICKLVYGKLFRVQSIYIVYTNVTKLFCFKYTKTLYVSRFYPFYNTRYLRYLSQLDYYNSLFRSLSQFNLHRLQSAQNSAARIVTNLSKYTRITPILRKLHWLPIQCRFEFKLATLVYKFSSY